jgi:hypothetical protein
VLCLCGRNDKLRARIAKRFGDEPRLRLMGFTDRMGDVLAAADALVHSSAGLTVLEAIIRGCPVISYGFGVGHVRASNHALVRFGLAQVARSERELGPALERALAHKPEPDGSFARRPSTASLILGDERRARQLPRWRLRTARAATTLVATVALAAWALTTGTSYKLVSHFVHMRPVTAVTTSRPEVGVLVDAPQSQIAPIASTLAASGIHVSFTLAKPPSANERSVLALGDQAVPRLPTGGLVRWLGTRGQLRRVTGAMGVGRHFLYASNGPSIGQWWLAHRAGGRLIAGAVRVEDTGDSLGQLHPGEVVELSVGNSNAVAPLADKLRRELVVDHLSAVPVGQLMHDASRPAA